MSDKSPAETPTPGPNSQEQKQTAPAFWTADFWENIGKFRDGLLVVGGLLYVLGYAVWSFNAWINGLGILPALEFQYLVAGIPPAFFICVVAFLIKSIWPRQRPAEVDKKHPASVPERLDEMGKSLQELTPEEIKAAEDKRLELLLKVGAGAFTILLIVYAVLKAKEMLPKFIMDRGEYGFAAIVSILLFAIVILLNYFEGRALQDNPSETPSKRLDNLRQSFSNFFWRGVIPALFGVGLIAAWMILLYPIVPQALGGVRPRCAQLDLARKDVSAVTLAAVVSATPSPTPTPTVTPSPATGAAAEQKASPANEVSVVRTDEVKVLFSGSDYMLIKAQDGRIYEIKKDVVQAVAVKSCD